VGIGEDVGGCGRSHSQDDALRIHASALDESLSSETNLESGQWISSTSTNTPMTVKATGMRICHGQVTVGMAAGELSYGTRYTDSHGPSLGFNPIQTNLFCSRMNGHVLIPITSLI
jgi:hypothetical protein